MTRARNEPDARQAQSKALGARAHAIAEGIIGAVTMEPKVALHCPMSSKNPRLHFVVYAFVDDVVALVEWPSCG